MQVNRIVLIITLIFVSNYSFTQSDLVVKVMNELEITIEDCDEMGQFPEKVLPFNKDLTVIVIPKTGKKEEGMFTLDSYVVVVNNKTKEIKHLYYESYKTSGWESDAVYINDISIDTAKYLVQENVRAFGVVIHTRSMSQPNPYSSNYISLFIPDGKKLQIILKNFEIYSYGGETNMNCWGKFFETKTTLEMLKRTTHGFFDIKIINNNSEINYKEKDDDCVESKTSTNSKQVLKFSDGFYKIQK